VLASPIPPVVEVSGPARTRGQGTLNAMLEGAGTGGAAGCTLTLYLCPFGLVAGGIIGAVAAAPLGAALAEPDLVVGREAALQQVVGGMAFGHALRDRVTALGQEHTTAVLDAVASPVEPPDTAPDIQTRLELAVERVALIGPARLTPPVALVVRIHARLVRVSDDTELYAQSLAYHGRPRELAEWSEARIRADLGWALDALAERVVDDVFLVRAPWP
jgi:hypothetical protein